MRCNPRILTPCLTAWRAVPLLLQEVPARPGQLRRSATSTGRPVWALDGASARRALPLRSMPGSQRRLTRPPMPSPTRDRPGTATLLDGRWARPPSLPKKEPLIHCRPLFAWGWMAWVPSDELPRARHGLLQGRCPPLSPTAAAKARKNDWRWTPGSLPELDGMDPANPPDGG